jgi:hypothetical protein
VEHATARGRHRLGTRPHHDGLLALTLDASGSVSTNRASYAVSGVRSRMLPANTAGGDAIGGGGGGSGRRGELDADQERDEARCAHADILPRPPALELC